MCEKILSTENPRNFLPLLVLVDTAVVVGFVFVVVVVDIPAVVDFFASHPPVAVAFEASYLALSVDYDDL